MYHDKKIHEYGIILSLVRIREKLELSAIPFANFENQLLIISMKVEKHANFGILLKKKLQFFILFP